MVSIQNPLLWNSTIYNTLHQSPARTKIWHVVLSVRKNKPFGISIKSYKIESVLQEFYVLAEKVMWISAIGYYNFEIYEFSI